MKGSRGPTPKTANSVAPLPIILHATSVRSHEIEDPQELEATFSLVKSYRGRTNPKPSREHSPDDKAASNRIQIEIHS